MNNQPAEINGIDVDPTKEILDQMDQEFMDAAKEIFGEFLVCCFINGRAALYTAKKGESDIDLFVVLKNNILARDGLFRNLWREFVPRYRDIHLAYGFRPDNCFPGDFATMDQIKEVIEGRGFSERDGRLYIQPMTAISDESIENDYRIFRSMWLIGRCIGGDNAYFKEKQSACTATIIKHLLLLRPGGITIDEMISELKSGKEKEKYGFDERYEPAFSMYITPLLTRSTAELIEQGWAQKKPDEKIVPTDKTLAWEQEVVSRIRTNNWQAEHLLHFQDAIVQQDLKEIFSGTAEATSHWEKLSKS